MQVSKYNRLALAAIAATAFGFSWPGGQPGGVTDIGQTPHYAQTAWAGVHRDARNSDYAPFVAPAVNEVKWEVLDGAAVLLAASIGPEGNRYVTTGRGPGTSHLHAFDRDGNLLWESPPQASLADLDSGAVGSGTLVDRQGDVYVSDYDQFWAFHSDGTLKWVSALPTAGQPFISAIITNEGFVGGVTAGGEVALFDRNDGSFAVPVFQLPAGDPPPAAPPRPALWVAGLMDPSIIPQVEAIFFGEVFQVANTPAVDPKTGRIYITAAGPALEDGSFTGLLYGLDIVGGEVQIAFAAPMGGGSGTSPAISPDGTQVYAADSDGVMTAFDADTGAVIWQATGGAGSASPGVGPDGTVYSGNSLNPLTVVALDPADGSTLWRHNYDWLGAEILPVLPPAPPFFTGQPTARFNSVVSISAEKIWVVLGVGYQFYNPNTGRFSNQVRVTLLVSLDPADGSVIGYTALRDTNEGLISIGSDGSLTVSHAAMLSSIHYYGINRLLAYYGFPPAYMAPGPPVAGLSGLGPVSYLDHAIEGVEWVGSLNATALAELPGGDLEAAFTATRRALTQLEATQGSVEDARDAGEISNSNASAANSKLSAALAQITSAREILVEPALKESAQKQAAKRLTQADKMLAEAMGFLAP
jgi:outer membrane protein assembly factor BamB